MKTTTWLARLQAIALTVILLCVGLFAGTTLGTLAWAQLRALELVGSNPFIRLVGREASGRSWEIQEAAGLLTIYNSTSGIANLTLGAAPNGGLGMYGVLYSALGANTNGTFAYCSDCTVASPCDSLGTGAIAKRLNGVWVCN